MAVSNYEELIAHFGHNVEVVKYGDNEDDLNVAIECTDCHIVLLDFNHPTDSELDYCYRMGRKSVTDGEDTENCHFTLFSSIEKADAWHRGKRDEEEQADSISDLLEPGD